MIGNIIQNIAVQLCLCQHLLFFQKPFRIVFRDPDNGSRVHIRSIQQLIAHLIHDLALLFQHLIIIYRMFSGRCGELFFHLLCAVDDLFSSMSAHLFCPVQVFVQVGRTVIFYNLIMNGYIEATESRIALSSGTTSCLTFLSDI